MMVLTEGGQNFENEYEMKEDTFRFHFFYES